MRALNRSHRDFITRKYLDGGLVRVKRGEAWELSYAVPGPDSGVVVSNAATHNSRTVSWSELDIESFSFEPCLVQVQGRAALLSRNGVQSTQRSLRPSDFEARPIVSRYVWGLYPPGGSLSAEARNIAERMDFRLRGTEINELARQFVEPRNYTLSQGIDVLGLEGGLDVVLNKDFALSRSLSKDPRPWLWYHQLPVGKLDAALRQIEVGHVDFRQELIDYLAHTNQVKGWTLCG